MLIILISDPGRIGNATLKQMDNGEIAAGGCGKIPFDVEGKWTEILAAGIRKLCRAVGG